MNAALGRVEVGAQRELPSGESVDDNHRGAAVGAVPGGGSIRGCGGWRAIARQQLLAEREAMRPESIGEEAKIPDSDEALRQHMQEEATQELCAQQRHVALLATTRIILPTEGDAFAVECQQAVIGNGDSMRIAAEIAQDFCRSAEGGLGVDHPVLTVHPAKKLAKLFWISQCGCRAGAAQLLTSMETFQAGAELATEHAAEDFHR